MTILLIFLRTLHIKYYSSGTGEKLAMIIRYFGAIRFNSLLEFGLRKTCLTQRQELASYLRKMYQQAFMLLSFKNTEHAKLHKHSSSEQYFIRTMQKQSHSKITITKRLQKQAYLVHVNELCWDKTSLLRLILSHLKMWNASQ